jgi:hypothetical protein
MIVLTVVDPQNHGVVAYDGALKSFGPASKNPARADAGSTRSALNQQGSQMRFSFDTSPTGTAITGNGDDDQRNALGVITIAIEGNAGEAAGSPVTLHLSAGGAGLPGHPHLVLAINDKDYPASRDTAITGLSVGGRFSFFGGLISGGSGKPYRMVVTLSVRPA